MNSSSTFISLLFYSHTHCFKNTYIISSMRNIRTNSYYILQKNACVFELYENYKCFENYIELHTYAYTYSVLVRKTIIITSTCFVLNFNRILIFLNWNKFFIPFVINVFFYSFSKNLKKYKKYNSFKGTYMRRIKIKILRKLRECGHSTKSDFSRILYFILYLNIWKNAWVCVWVCTLHSNKSCELRNGMNEILLQSLFLIFVIYRSVWSINIWAHFPKYFRIIPYKKLLYLCRIYFDLKILLVYDLLRYTETNKQKDVTQKTEFYFL